MMRSLGFIALIVFSLGVAGYAVRAYGILPLGAAIHQPALRASIETHRASVIYSHVFASVVALALGPFQFWGKLRSTRPALHRWSGRLYLGIGVLFGGLAGFIAAFNAFGGPIARFGFGCLAVAWLFTGFMAYRAIRADDRVSHRRWMFRNFALTFAAVTLRLWVPGLLISGVSIETAYPVIAWVCWVPNLVVAELLFLQMHDASMKKTPAVGRADR